MDQVSLQLRVKCSVCFKDGMGDERKEDEEDEEHKGIQRNKKEE